jgi:short-subunit dehydrogenase
MHKRGQRSILITGSIAGFIGGRFQAVYNGAKAFLDSFSFALREELRDTKLTSDLHDARHVTEIKFFGKR